MPFGAAFAVVFDIVICAFIAFAGAYWILSGWLDRRLSGREAFALGFGLLALLFYSISLALGNGPGILILAGVVFGAALLLKGLARYADRSITKQMDDTDIAKYQQAIEQYPDNPHPHSLLADVYRRLGRNALAAEEYTLALELDPSLKEERYWLEKMRTEIENSQSRQMSCPRCGTARRGAELECLECGRPYSSIETWRHGFRTMEPAKRAIWLAFALAAAAAVVAVAVFVPGSGALLVTGVLLAGPIVLLVLSIRLRRRDG